MRKQTEKKDPEYNTFMRDNISYLTRKLHFREKLNSRTNSNISFFPHYFTETCHLSEQGALRSRKFYASGRHLTESGKAVYRGVVVDYQEEGG